ncbi:MAG TPA: hypothetical protein VFU81_02920 [Thermomicrobiales bacterium]|nr:hypothetical protein [Thermomicrobiales bacterium]
MRQRSVWWLVAAAATALAIAIPAVLWQTWSGAAVPTAPRGASAKRAKRVAATNDRVATKKGVASSRDSAATRADANANGTVFFDANGTPLARFVPLRFTDPAAGGAPAGERNVETTIAMQNLASAPLRLNGTMFRVRDVNGGLHAPTLDEATGGAAAAATPAAAQRTDRPAKSAKSTKPAHSTEPAKLGKAAKTPKAKTAARQAATPRARASNRSAGGAGASATAGAPAIEIGPGQTRTETLRFAVPATTRIASILFAPDQDHLVSLAILPQQAAAIATAAASGAPDDHAAKGAKPAKPRATPQR